MADLVTSWVLQGAHGVQASQGRFWFTADGKPLMLRITRECSAMLLVAPLLLISGVLALTRRYQPGRFLGGIAASLVIVLVGNQIRIAGIAWAYAHFGKGGYEVAHIWAGSVVSMITVGIGIGIVLSSSKSRSRASETGRS